MRTKIAKIVILVTLISFLSMQTATLTNAGIWQGTKEWVSKKVTNPNAELSYSEYYSKSHKYIWWAITACAAIACALAIYFSAGTASPIVIGIGTWIGKAAGLTGIAATNYGLALLGGGSIAAGGFGVAGGTVVLTSVLAGGGSIIFDVTLDKALEKYDESKFMARARQMPIIPLPRKDDGSDAFEEIVNHVDKYYDQEKSNIDPENLSVVNNAINQIDHILSYKKEDDYKDIQQLKVLKSLLHLNIADYPNAATISYKEINEFMKREVKLNDKIGDVPEPFITNFPFNEAETKCSLPLSIWSISSLSSADVDLSTTTRAVGTALALEPKNKLNPLLLSIYMDRLLLRQDKIKAEYFQSLYSTIFANIEKKEISTPCYQVILIRSYIMAKKHQDFLRIVKNTPIERFKDKEVLFDRCRLALQEYNLYNTISELCLDMIKKDGDFMDDKQNKKEYAGLVFGLKNYQYHYTTLNSEIAKRMEDNINA